MTLYPEVPQRHVEYPGGCAHEHAEETSRGAKHCFALVERSDVK